MSEFWEFVENLVIATFGLTIIYISSRIFNLAFDWVLDWCGVEKVVKLCEHTSHYCLLCDSNWPAISQNCPNHFSSHHEIRSVIGIDGCCRRDVYDCSGDRQLDV